MNTILVTEPKKNQATKSLMSLALISNLQVLTLIVPRTLKLLTGEMVRINVALPHALPFLEGCGVVFTHDFHLTSCEYTKNSHKKGIVYQFEYPLTFATEAFIMPSCRVSGLVVFE